MLLYATNTDQKFPLLLTPLKVLWCVQTANQWLWTWWSVCFYLGVDVRLRQKSKGAECFKTQLQGSAIFHKVLGSSAKISNEADTWHVRGFLHCADLMAFLRRSCLLRACPCTLCLRKLALRTIPPCSHCLSYHHHIHSPENQMYHCCCK